MENLLLVDMFHYSMSGTEHFFWFPVIWLITIGLLWLVYRKRKIATTVVLSAIVICPFAILAVIIDSALFIDPVALMLVATVGVAGTVAGAGNLIRSAFESVFEKIENVETNKKSDGMSVRTAWRVFIVSMVVIALVVYWSLLLP